MLNKGKKQPITIILAPNRLNQSSARHFLSLMQKDEKKDSKVRRTLFLLFSSFYIGNATPPKEYVTNPTVQGGIKLEYL